MLVRLWVREITGRSLRRAASRLEAEPGRPRERDLDARPPLDTLDDWILFGPRMR